MSGPTLFTLGDTPISLAGTSASIDGMTSIGTLNAGTSHHFINNGNESMTITPGGSVGIGTNEPSSMLHISGPVTNTTAYSITNPLLKLTQTNTGSPEFTGIVIECNENKSYW